MFQILQLEKVSNYFQVHFHQVMYIHEMKCYKCKKKEHNFNLCDFLWYKYGCIWHDSIHSLECPDRSILLPSILVIKQGKKIFISLKIIQRNWILFPWGELKL